MESTVLVLIASSLSVLFGWQPMPDDDQRVEYIVQIDPELAATLHEGQAIPITCDIPKDIGPIGRIRIVVGREALPQISRTINLKPWPEETTGTGLIQTQFTTPADTRPSNMGDRYGSSAGQGTKPIFPPSAGIVRGMNPAGAPASDPFTRAPQAKAGEARGLGKEAKSPILPPRGEQLFGKSDTGSRVRPIGSDLEQDSRNSMDAFGKSLLPKSLNAGGGISPPAGQTGGSRANGEILPSTVSGNRQDNPQASKAPIYPANSRRIDKEVFEHDDQQRRAAPPLVATRLPATTPVSNVNSNPTSNSGDFISESRWPDTRVASSVGIGADNYRGNEIDLQPARRENSWPRDLESANREEPHARSDVDYPLSGKEANSFGDRSDDLSYVASGNPDQEYGGDRSSRNQIAEIHGSDYEEPPASKDNENDNNVIVIPMLLAVLLTGSGAGNFYLLWSYVDVRRKYQGVVHGSSPRHRDRYDD